MPQSNDIPTEVLEFISRRIDSVPHLEALLLLWEHTPKEWNDVAVSARIYVNPERGHAVLEELAQHGLIAAGESGSGYYRFDPSWDSAQIMPTIAKTYRRHLVNIASLIHAKSSSDAVRQFADAFQINKKE